MLDDQKYECAGYRVRLFLSVDLSGSTQFKNSTDGETREQASPKWVTTFEDFYRDFPAKFRSKYASHKTAQVGNDDCPELWKAVGDELVFCGRVTNRKTVLVAVMSFVDTLQDYRKTFVSKSLPLNLKGSAWIAAFPEPNRAINLRSTGEGADFLTASEALENAADTRPFEYDFLGKSIDTGFRIGSFARPERFILSVELAQLLARSDLAPAQDGPGPELAQLTSFVADWITGSAA